MVYIKLNINMILINYSLLNALVLKIFSNSEAKQKKQKKTHKKPKTKDQKKNVSEISYWFVISKKKPIMLEYEFCKEISKLVF